MIVIMVLGDRTWQVNSRKANRHSGWNNEMRNDLSVLFVVSE
jgi:hypothetical protein